jgi:hypothetical protein
MAEGAALMAAALMVGPGFVSSAAGLVLGGTVFLASVGLPPEEEELEEDELQEDKLELE